MTTTEQQILALLARRQGIDKTPEGSFTGNHRWLIEAVELLLRHQIENPSAQAQAELMEQLSRQLELSFELVEELRNAGILR